MAVNVVLKSVFDDKGIRNAQAEFGKVGKTIGGAMAVVGAAVAGASIAFARFGVDAVKGAEEAAIAQRRLDQVAKSMGVFGTQAAVVSKRLGEFAEANELIVGVDADLIKSTQAKLLTFKNLAETADTVGGSMDRATMAALDLAATGFGSAESNAVQLGKALQDPIKGITALARAGVTFTAQEKDKIRVLVESGRVLDAQNLILSAIETQVGGTAEATASAFTKIELAGNQVKDAIGEALLPVFEDLAEELVKITPEIANALAPAAENLATIFRNQVLPAIVDFTKWLASPAGTKKIQELTDAIIKGVTELIKFTDSVIKNWDAIKQTAVVVGTFAIVFGTLKTALQLATAAQLLFNAAVKANPYVIAATALATLISLAFAGGTAMAGFAEDQKKARESSTGLTGRLAELVAEQKRLKELVDAGVISYGDYKKAIGPVNSELAALQGAMMRAAGAGRDLNKVSIGSLRGQLSAAAGEANRFRNILAGIPATTGTTITTTTGSSGPSLAEQRAAAAKDFAKLVKDTKNQIADAKSVYQKTVTKAGEVLANASQRANEAYSKAVEDATTARNTALEQAAKDNTRTVESINKTATDRLADVVRQSIDRLRSAYQSAVAVDVGRLFAEEAVGKNVDKLVQNLRDKLAASRRLVANASALSAQGFSQTFIEQVVSAGTDAGNELSQAILNATPETRNELQSLFGALENESETGMDALSQEIYDKAGLATNALKSLYAQTQNELTASLKQQAEAYATQQANIMREFDDALRSAKVARDNALRDANKAYADSVKEAFDEYKTDLDKIEKEYKEKLGGIEGLSAALTRQARLLQSQIGTAGNFRPTVTAPTNDLLAVNAAAFAQSQAAPQTTINLTVNAGMGADGADIGRKIVDEIVRFERSSGQVFARFV